MSIAVTQFVEIVRCAYAAIEAAHACRRCLVCDCQTKQTREDLPAWTRWKCLDCGFIENVQKEPKDA